ncbi:MAG TPA: hypothetical protein PLB81_08840, partial [Deltaproteobacteria bacterium]|nr:hypothetical protein [Deltaproteobacteria bacterium]
SREQRLQYDTLYITPDGVWSLKFSHGAVEACEWKLQKCRPTLSITFAVLIFIDFMTIGSIGQVSL